jgi:ankyrin repeat protein
MRKTLCYYVLFFFSFCLTAQNKFENKAYWTAQPSLQKVKQDFTKVNDYLKFNANKFDAISWAIIKNCDTEVVKFLVDTTKVEVNRRLHDERTYLFWAVYAKNFEVFDMLIEKGADLNLLDNHGYNLANYAMTYVKGDTNYYASLIQRGVDLFHKDTIYGANSFLLALPNLIDITQVSFFLRRGFGLSDTDTDQRNALYYAVKGGDLKIIDYLLNRGVLLNTENSHRNVLFAAIEGTRYNKNELAVYHYLMDKGATLKCVDEQKNTALHLALQNQLSLDIVSFFCENAIDLNYKNSQNKTALDLIISKTDNLELLKYLWQQGAQTNNNGTAATAYQLALNNPNFSSSQLKFFKQ